MALNEKMSFQDLLYMIIEDQIPLLSRFLSLNNWNNGLVHWFS